jgi:hypothetical protein
VSVRASAVAICRNPAGWKSAMIAARSWRISLAEYRRRRGRVFGRTRRLTPKLAAVAQFAIEHDNVPWPQRMQLGNASSSRSARYRKVATFRRDCEQALTRLRDLRLPRGGKKR